MAHLEKGNLATRQMAGKWGLLKSKIAKRHNFKWLHNTCLCGGIVTFSNLFLNSKVAFNYTAIINK